MMMLAILVRKLVAPSLRYVVYFRQHPEPTEEIDGSLNRYQIDVAVRQLLVDSRWS
jgi:hypothetical protein